MERGVMIVRSDDNSRVYVDDSGLDTDSYGYGSDPHVVTQREFETMLLHGHPLLSRLDSVVMIQCVDSREGDHNYCSRICCGEAVKNALRFKRQVPGANVIVLYRDVRTYGLNEDRYAEARRAGILFLRYSEDRKPEVRKNSDGEFLVTLYDEILQNLPFIPKPIRVESLLDLLARSLGARASREVAVRVAFPLLPSPRRSED